jgi:peptidyl-dipeptidase A
VAAEALRPWHWEDPFGQEAPGVGTVELDGVFRDHDAVQVAAEFFRGIGLPADDVLARSDLYEREGKDQHAFCIDVDREGDVRILCNMRPNEKWMGVLLHELGHAVYDSYVPRDLPYIVRGPAHILTTEAVAMYMGRLTRDPAWLREVMGAGLGEDEAADVRAQLRAAMLVAARWMLVMAYFERELYRDPDRADLNALWWELVERLQMVRRPDGRDEPDWASKIHLSGAPVYYHNYLLGELMASQMSPPRAAASRAAAASRGRSRWAASSASASSSPAPRWTGTSSWCTPPARGCRRGSSWRSSYRGLLPSRVARAASPSPEILPGGGGLCSWGRPGGAGGLSGCGTWV